MALSDPNPTPKPTPSPNRSVSFVTARDRHVTDV